MKNLIIMTAILFSSLLMAQTNKSVFFEATALQTGYSYLGKNYGYIGFDKRIDNQKDWIYANIGAGTLIGKLDNKLEIIPEIHSNITLLVLLAEVSVTTKAVNQSLGFNLANRITVKSGYNFAYNKDDFEGITFGININFGSEVYHHLSSMKFL